MIATPEPQKMTVEAYLQWEAQQELRYEYVNGDIFAMTGGTIPHNDIALNLYTALRPHLRPRNCRVNVSDVKVQVTSTIYLYPDLMVSCDERDRNAVKAIQYPKLITEVLSPGTETYDRKNKFALYRKFSTLEEYVLIDSESISVECYRRSGNRRWIYEPYAAGDTITLESIEFSCAIELLYESVQFNP
jgi:Uma2 family endonuclease